MELTENSKLTQKEELVLFSYFPAGICLLKGNNRNTRTRCEICSKLTIKTLGRRQWCSGVSVSIVNFEQVNVGWEVF